MNVVEPFISAEGAGAEWGCGVVAVEIGAEVAVGGIWKGAGIWICVVVVGGLGFAVVYSIHVHIHGVGRAVEVDRVGFESFRNLLYEFSIEVEGVAGLQVSGVHVVVLGDLVLIGDDELGGETVGNDLVEIVAENKGFHIGLVVIFAHSVEGVD